MTGFGKAVVELPHKKITVEIKSLNSKQLDLSTRIPQQYREMEMEIRSEIAKRLERGKVDFFANVKLCHAPIIEISSTQIRQGISEGKNMNYFIPRPVYDYIINHGLYKNKD